MAGLYYKQPAAEVTQRIAGCTFSRKHIILLLLSLLSELTRQSRRARCKHGWLLLGSSKVGSVTGLIVEGKLSSAHCPETLRQPAAFLEEQCKPRRAAESQSGGTATARKVNAFTGETTNHSPCVSAVASGWLFSKPTASTATHNVQAIHSLRLTQTVNS